MSLATGLVRKLVAEAVGTGLLIVAVIGSGIAAQKMSPTDTGLQLLENALATGAALVALILMRGPVSGAHFNPVVTIVNRVHGVLTTAEAMGFIAAQVVGGCAGAVLTNIMFDLDPFMFATHERAAGHLWLSEVVATVGLLLVIFSLVRTKRSHLAPVAVGAWITGAYWFTSSTSFANPAVTVARTLSNTFAGIKPSSAPMFIVMQLVGTIIAIGLIVVLFPAETEPTI